MLTGNTRGHLISTSGSSHVHRRTQRLVGGVLLRGLTGDCLSCSLDGLHHVDMEGSKKTPRLSPFKREGEMGFLSSRCFRAKVRTGDVSWRTSGGCGFCCTVRLSGCRYK